MRVLQSDPSRRSFLTALAGTTPAMLLGSDWPRSADVDLSAAQIVSKAIAVDMHNHVQIQFAKEPEDGGANAEIDLAGEMKRSGFSAICQTYGVDSVPSLQVGDYYKYHLQALAFEDELLKRNNMRRALNLNDLRIAHQRKQPVIIQSSEGAQFIEGRLERLEETYKRGLRHLQLVHERDDVVSPLADVYTAAPHLGGLTPFGAEVIKECNRLGIVVDLAHGTYDTVKGALKTAKQPLIISHAAVKNDAAKTNISADMQRRLIPEEQARAVADAGGVIGIWCRLFNTMSEYVAAVKQKVNAWGVDHVGIGSDTDMTASYVLPYTNKIWPEQNGGLFYAVAGEMLKQGFTPEEIGKIGGGNFCRVFGQVTAGQA